MVPGAKIKMRQMLFLDKRQEPYITGGTNSAGEMITNTSGKLIGWQTSSVANPGDIMEVVSKVKIRRECGKQFQLKDPRGNIGWFFWAFVYTNADMI